MFKQFLASTLLVCSIAAPAHAADDRVHMSATKERGQIEAWSKKWKSLLETGDIDAMRSMYEPDAVLMTNGQPAIHGVDAILEFLGRNKAAGNRVTIDFGNEELVVEGNRAYLTAKYWMTINLPNGKQIAAAGRSFLVFKRGPDDQWRLWRDMDNQAPDVLPEDRPG